MLKKQSNNIYINIILSVSLMEFFKVQITEPFFLAKPTPAATNLQLEERKSKLNILTGEYLF